MNLKVLFFFKPIYIIALGGGGRGGSQRRGGLGGTTVAQAVAEKLQRLHTNSSDFQEVLTAANNIKPHMQLLERYRIHRNPKL